MKIHKIPNQIIKGKLTPLNTKNVTGIALHHMANANWSVKDVENYHVNSNGWTAIGYNYWIAFDGTIYEGRGFNQGAGVDKQNSTVISIGFQGDYHSKPVSMPDEQFNAGIDIITYVKSKLPYIRKIGGHRDYMATQCPGEYFPLNEMISGVRREVEETVMIYNYIDDNTAKIAEDCNECLTHLVNKGYLRGNEKGELNLTLEMIRLLLINYRAGLYK